MDLTPNNIRNQEFSTQMRGYDKDAVDQFADSVAEAVEALKQTNIKLSMELETVKEQLAGLQEFENAIKSAAIDARRNADQTMADAKKAADELLAEARTEAERTIEANRHKIELVEQQLSAIQKTRSSYLSELQDLLNGHLMMAQNIEHSEANAIPKDEEIHVTASAEVDESQTESIAESSEEISLEQAGEKNDMAESAAIPVSKDTAPVKVQSSDTEKLKELMAEPGQENEKQESPIDPELAAALNNYKHEVSTETPSAPVPPAPKQGEMVETTARAEDIPDGFITNSNEPPAANSDQPAPTGTTGIDIASELDNVAAKFEEEMDKAEHSQ